MNRLILISCCWSLKKTLAITTILTNPESASGIGKKNIFLNTIKETLCFSEHHKRNLLTFFSSILDSIFPEKGWCSQNNAELQW